MALRGLNAWIKSRPELNARRAEEILKRIQYGDTTKAEVDWLRAKNELPEGTFMSVRKMCRQIINKNTVHEITQRLKR